MLVFSGLKVGGVTIIPKGLKFVTWDIKRDIFEKTPTSPIVLLCKASNTIAFVSTSSFSTETS